MLKKILLIVLVGVYATCFAQQKSENGIADSTLGFINSDVFTDDASFKKKAQFSENDPGDGLKLNRSFENAPPLIPHTTDGFFPIKRDDNICLDCHLPEEAEETGAVPVSKTHFTTLRESLTLENNKYKKPDESKVNLKKLDQFNPAYFNCSQCHVPQSKVTSNIENLFTPEFRQKFGLHKSSLLDDMNDGIEK